MVKFYGEAAVFFEFHWNNLLGLFEGLALGKCENNPSKFEVNLVAFQA
jgi:hypothetical protein